MTAEYGIMPWDLDRFTELELVAYIDRLERLSKQRPSK